MRLAGSKASLQSIDSLGERAVSLMPTEPEDMWHANNLISASDTLKAPAIRRVVRQTATGSTISERVHTNLTILVKSTFFDPVASAMHVSGTVVSENAFVALGQHHTLDLELNRAFTLSKKGGWDSVALDTLKNALRADTGDAIAAVVMQEGLANICLITDYQPLLKQRFESAAPKKHPNPTDKEGGARRYFEKVLSTLLRAVDFESPRPLLLASPGFVAQNFRTYMVEMGVKRADKLLQRIARDAVVVHSSSGHVHALNEILKSTEVQATMRDKKFSAETKAVDSLFARLRTDEGRAWYGVKPVEKAVREGAVGRGGGLLLVNNSLFRSLDIGVRKRYVDLVDKVKEDGGEVRILSSDHESGQRLDTLGGIAAILTYPMHDLDEEDGDEESDAEELRANGGFPASYDHGSSI